MEPRGPGGIEPGAEDHTGHIGILKIRVPEPRGVLLLVAGVAALVLLQRVSRRDRGLH